MNKTSVNMDESTDNSSTPPDENMGTHIRRAHDIINQTGTNTALYAWACGVIHAQTAGMLLDFIEGRASIPDPRTGQLHTGGTTLGRTLYEITDRIPPHIMLRLREADRARWRTVTPTPASISESSRATAAAWSACHPHHGDHQ